MHFIDDHDPRGMHVVYNLELNPHAPPRDLRYMGAV